MVALCSFGFSEIHCVDQADLKRRDLLVPVSASQILGLKSVRHYVGLGLFSLLRRGLTK